jgi:hypothetical protein
LSYPDAERREAARGAGASHLVDQRRGEAGAAATKRVTDRNRAAVDVQLFVRDAELALAGEGLRTGPSPMNAGSTPAAALGPMKAIG